MRLLYLAGGLLAVAIGGIGIFVPGLPTTVFFIIAAWCFSKSSPRLERWVLDLPGIGPMVTDYRNGLGMPRRAKFWAIGTMMLAVGISAIFLISNLTVRLIVVAVGAVGVWWVAVRTPTRETVLAMREAEHGSIPPPAGL
ncbi:MAG: YbaN family protein [Actinomycetota bacterium]